MGKYMRKAKVSGEVAVMEVSHQSTLGVRTRARTLALQKPSTDTSSLAYLELRSRRLEKPHFEKPKDKETAPKETAHSKPSPSPNHNPSSPKAGRGQRTANSGSGGSVSVRGCSKKAAAATAAGASAEVDGGVEVSFGENVLEAEVRDRSVRETTPCSLIRDSETIGTPGSTTRPTNSTANNRRMQSTVRRNIPTAHEMEEFFVGAEQLQQRIFTEKYNFDPVNDHPLPGRYEWVKLDS